MFLLWRAYSLRTPYLALYPPSMSSRACQDAREVRDDQRLPRLVSGIGVRDWCQGLLSGVEQRADDAREVARIVGLAQQQSFVRAKLMEIVGGRRGHEDDVGLVARGLCAQL